MTEPPPSPAPPAPPAGSVSSGTAQAARSIVVLAGSELVAKAATFALMVVAARVLGRADYGAFSYALAIGMLLATLPTWGFDDWVVQSAIGDRSRAGELIGLVLVLRGAIVVLLLAGTAVAAVRTDDPDVGIVLLLMVLSCLLDTVTTTGRAAAGALDRQARVAGVLVAQRCATALIGVLLLATGAGILSLGIAFVSGSLVALVGMAAAVRRLGVRPSRVAVTLPSVRDSLRATVPIGIDAVVGMVLFRVDVVLLGVLRGDEEVGGYSAAYRLVETVLFVTWSVSRALFPTMAAAGEADPQRVRRGVERGLAVVAALFVPYAAVLLLRGEDLLVLLFGGEFAGAAVVLAWLSGAPLMFGLGYLLSYAMLGMRRNAVALWASVVALVVNLALNLALIPPLGGTGAAVATTLSYAAEAAVLYVVCRRVLDRAPRLLAPVAVPAVASLPAVGALLLPLPVLPAMVLAGVVYLPAWVAAAAALDREQLAVLRGLVTRRSA